MSNINDQAKTVINTLIKAMDDLQMKYDRVTDNVFAFGFSGDDLDMKFKMIIDPDRKLIVLASPLPFSAKTDKILPLAIAISQINNGLIDGNFDLDVSDGTVSFRMTTSFRESLIAKEALQYMISCAVHTVDEFNDKLLLVASGALDAKEYIKTL